VRQTSRMPFRTPSFEIPAPLRRWSGWGTALVVVFVVGWPSAAHAASIRVEACPSTYGNVGKHPVPSLLRPDAQVPRGFVFYANQALAVLAPEGWSCRGAVGVDGSGYVAVTGLGGAPLTHLGEHSEPRMLSEMR